MNAAFHPEPDISKIAEAYALDAVDIAADNFGVSLDWSEGSIESVEQMLSELHEELAGAAPSEEAVWTFAKAFGSYVGEVMRRHHGGEWGMVELDGQSFPGLSSGDGLCWPWGKVHNRLVNGPEDNVWHYYVALTRPQAER
jgi:hypothetical protein